MLSDKTNIGSWLHFALKACLGLSLLRSSLLSALIHSPRTYLCFPRLHLSYIPIQEHKHRQHVRSSDQEDRQGKALCVASRWRDSGRYRVVHNFSSGEFEDAAAIRYSRRRKGQSSFPSITAHEERNNAQIQPIGPIQAFRQTLAQRGIKGMYAGCTAVVIGNAVKAGVRFTTYDQFKMLLKDSDVSMVFLVQVSGGIRSRSRSRSRREARCCE